VVERKAKRGRTPGRLVPQEGLELDTVGSGSAGNDGGTMMTEMTGIAKGAQ
jgi:hypothetical protein